MLESNRLPLRESMINIRSRKTIFLTVLNLIPWTLIGLNRNYISHIILVFIDIKKNYISSSASYASIYINYQLCRPLQMRLRTRLDLLHKILSTQRL